MPPRVQPLPKISPIVLQERPHPFDDPAWLFEPKFDGFRGLLTIDGDAAAFTSKKGLPLKRFSELAQDVRRALPVSSAIFDGEVLAIDEQGRHNFQALMSRTGELHYAAFDLLWLNGADLRDRPLIQRRSLLESLIRETTPLLSRTMAVPGTGTDLFEAVKRLDLEGIVAKRMVDPYAADTIWFKVKNRQYSQATPERFERFNRKR